MGKRLIIYTDGSCKGNPGPASIGVVAYLEGTPEPVFTISRQIGVATNNQAEYQALINALSQAICIEATEVEIRSDSEVLTNQINGSYQIKNLNLIPLYEEAKMLSRLFQKFSIQSVPRKQNKEADALANQAYNT